jgi:hypothetical protein
MEWHTSANVARTDVPKFVGAAAAQSHEKLTPGRRRILQTRQM